VKGEIHKGGEEDREGKAGRGEEGKGMQGTPVCVCKFSIDSLCDHRTVINL